MQITLSPETEAVVASDVASGRYQSVEEYVAEAVELLHERQQWLGDSHEEEHKLEVSWEQAQRGELLDEEEVRGRMKAMKAEWAGRHSA